MSLIKGIHHVSMKCSSTEEYEKTIDFYKNILGIPVAREWQAGIMLDTGNGIVEIFNDGDDARTRASVRTVILYFSPIIILSDNATGLVFTLYISCMKYSLSYKLRYPLTADAAIPAINCFWKNRYISKTGMIDIAVAAKSAP